MGAALQTAARLLLGALMLLAGIAHLTFRRVEFRAQVPPWVPLSEDFVVVASGIVELLLGALMIFARKWRAPVGVALALFYVLVFPGNVSQYVHGIDAFGLNTDRARLIRLFFQPLLILWALWSTGGWKFLKNAPMHRQTLARKRKRYAIGERRTTRLK